MKKSNNKKHDWADVVRTEMRELMVSGVRRTHIWLEFLHGEDQGMRVSVPRYSEFQNSDITNKLQDLEEGYVVSASLESPDKLPRNWIVNSLEIKYKKEE